MATFSPAFWPMIAAVAAFFGLGAMLIIHIVRYAYTQGQTDQRLCAVEKGIECSGGLQVAVAALAATVTSLQSSVNRFDRALEKLDGRVDGVSARRSKISEIS